MNNTRIIIDVRTPGEYEAGHIPGAINIPLQELNLHLDKIKDFSPPVILCCASGYRSGQASAFLQSKGIECIDGGSWKDIIR